MQWNEKLSYDARFVPEDNLFHRGLEVLQLLALATAIEHIRPVEYMKFTQTHPTTFVFCLSLALSTFLHIKRHMDVYHNVIGGEEAKHHSLFDARRKTVALVPLLIGTVWAGYDYITANRNGGDPGNVFPILSCLVAFMAEQIFVQLDLIIWLPASGYRYQEIRVPINIDFSIHRLGEWVMLMLGESVLSLLIVEESGGSRYYITFYSGILSVTLMQYLFFRSQPFEAADHAMRRDRVGGMQFFYGMLAYSASLILIGCSFKMILHHYLDDNEEVEEEHEPHHSMEESTQRIANLFSWSMASSFFFLDLMVVAHRGWVANLSRLCNGGRISWTHTLIFILAWLLVIGTACLSMWITNLEVLSAVGCGIVCCQVLLRTLGMRFFPVSKDAMEKAHRWPNITEPQSIPSNANL